MNCHQLISFKIQTLNSKFASLFYEDKHLLLKENNLKFIVGKKINQNLFENRFA